MPAGLTSARAAVAVAPLATQIQTFPIPKVSDEDAWLKVEACGVCGTDWEFYERTPWGAKLGPIILGHEIVGEIVSIGDTAARKWGVAEGSRVAVEEFLPCGVCSRCRSGNYRLCSQTDSRGDAPFLRYGAVSTQVRPSLWGGFAEIMYLHPDSVIHKLPPGLGAEIATLFIPISNGIRWVTQEVAPTVGGTIVIMGPGQHGLGCVLAAKESGFAKIVVAGLSRDEPRLEMAKRLGATHTVEVDREDLVATTLDLTNGDGADVVIDIVPNVSSTLVDAAKMIRPCGDVLTAATKLGSGEISYLANELLKKSATLHGVRGHDRSSVEPALNIIHSGRYSLEAMCTHTFGLEKVDEGLKTSKWGLDGAIHVTVVPES